MERIVEYKTALDDIEFGFWPDEDSLNEGTLQEVEPMTDFERACVDTVINLKLVLQEELVEIGKRLDALES